MGQITVTLDLDKLAFEAVEQETNVEHLIRKYCAEEVEKHIQEKVLGKLGDQMSTQAKAMIEKEVNTVVQRQLEGKIIQIDPKSERVIVQGRNMVSKTMKKRSQQDKGGIMEVEAPIHVSNVQLVSKDSVSRIGYRIENGKKVRYAKKTGEVL